MAHDIIRTLSILGQRGNRDIMYYVKVIKDLDEFNSVVIINKKPAKMSCHDGVYRATRMNELRLTTIFQNGLLIEKIWG